MQISHSDIICALGYCLEAKNAQCLALIFTSLELGVLLNSQSLHVIGKIHSYL